MGDAHGTPRGTTRPPDEAEVEVHVGYTDTWEPGFSVAETLPEGLRLRRRSHLQILPFVFSIDKVRPAVAGATPPWGG